MKIIPSEKIEIETEFPNQEVRKILMEYIQPKKGLIYRFNNPKKNKFFEGDFKHDKFEIQRIITGNNSFLPQIIGRIEPKNKGTILFATLKVRIFTIIFMAFWMVGVGFAFVMGIIGVINQGTNPITLIFPLIMVAFGIGLVHYGFNTEKEKSINELKRILNGQIKEKMSTTKKLY